MSRREQLQAMLAEQPGDPFLRYALALELDKAGDHDEALKLFHELMDEPPDGTRPYVPAFFMAGQMLARLTRLDEARDCIQRGIEQADLQGDAHAAEEMRSFLNMLAD